jgi:hypothetical protein
MWIYSQSVLFKSQYYLYVSRYPAIAERPAGAGDLGHAARIQNLNGHGQDLKITIESRQASDYGFASLPRSRLRCRPSRNGQRSESTGLTIRMTTSSTAAGSCRIGRGGCRGGHIRSNRRTRGRGSRASRSRLAEVPSRLPAESRHPPGRLPHPTSNPSALPCRARGPIRVSWATHFGSRLRQGTIHSTPLTLSMVSGLSIKVT